MRYFDSVRSERLSVPIGDALSCGNGWTTDIRASARGIRVTGGLLLNTAAQSGRHRPAAPAARRSPVIVSATFPRLPVICVTTIVSGSAHRPIRFAYSAAHGRRQLEG